MDFLHGAHLETRIRLRSFAGSLLCTTVLLGLFANCKRSPFASESECEALWANLMKREEFNSVLDLQNQFDKSASMDAMGQGSKRMIEGLRASVLLDCQKRLTSKQVECMIAARTALEGEENCEPDFDRRKPSQIPTPERCEEVAIHLKKMVIETGSGRSEELAELKEELAKADPVDAVRIRGQIESAADSIEGKRKVAENYSSTARRECRRYKTRKEIHCLLSAKTFREVVRCRSSL